MASKVVAKKVGRRSFLKTVSGLSIATAGIFLAIVSPGCTENSDSDSDDSGDQSSRAVSDSDSGDQSSRSATDSDSSDQSSRSATDSDSSDQSGRSATDSDSSDQSGR